MLTPYPDVNDALNLLQTGVTSVLGDHLVALILHGSLAYGDFNPGRSDIDFLVVTDDKLPDDLLQQVIAMHAAITASGLKWATKLEGSYIPRADLNRRDPALYPALRCDGSFDIDGHGDGWTIICHVIREKGIALVGPSPQTLIDPIGPDALRRATRGVLHGWWVPKLTHPGPLHEADYQAYAVLTMCRMLYTVDCGKIATKPEAAHWALERFGGQWADLIEEALAWQYGTPMDRLDDVLAMIRWTVERIAG